MNDNNEMWNPLEETIMIASEKKFFKKEIASMHKCIKTERQYFEKTHQNYIEQEKVDYTSTKCIRRNIIVVSKD